MDSQIERIRKAEEAARELLDFAAKIRRELEDEDTKDPAVRRELVEAIEGLEREAQQMKDALREWREGIH